MKFLLVRDDEFSCEFEEFHGEYGNRWSPWEYTELFEKLGSSDLDFSPNIMVENNYLDDLLSPTLTGIFLGTPCRYREQLKTA